MIKAITSVYTMFSKHGFADIMQNQETGEMSLHATRFFDQEEVLSAFTAAKVLATPTYLTVQTGIDQHILLEPVFLQYINHSCHPNVFFDTNTMQLIAIKAIQPGDELLFFYPSTEWDMVQPFDCYCGSAECLHKISGAAHLSKKAIKQYRLTQFILQQLQNQKKK